MDVVATEDRLGPEPDAPHEAKRPNTTVDLGALFEANAPPLYRTILAFTGGRADIAEEAVAEAFARAAASRRILREPVAWLYRVAFNVAIDEMRARRRLVGDAIPDLSIPDAVGSSEVFEALGALAPRQRAAVVLFHVMDLPIREVARRMGVAAPTVRVHLVRGRARLRELLGDEVADD